MASSPIPQGASPHTDIRADRALCGFAALALLAAWCACRVLVGAPVFPFDDAYITVHNAQVLHWGSDTNYPGSPALTGATSAVHLGIVWALMFLLPPAWAADTACWLAALAYTLGIIRLAQLHRASRTQTVLLAVLGLFAARVPYQMLNGMETGWAMAGIVWALAAASFPGRPAQREAAPAGRRLMLAAICGLLPFLRPELALLSGLLLALAAWEHWRGTRVLRATLLLCARDLAIAALFAAPWLLWYRAATGSFLPSAIAAKRAFFAEQGLPYSVKWQWTVRELHNFGVLLGGFLPGALSLAATRVGRACLLFGAGLAGAYWYYFPGGLGHYQQRYLYLLVPLLLFGWASALRYQPARAPRVVTILLIAAAFQAVFLFPGRWNRYVDGLRFTRTERSGAAEWCTRNLPPEALLLVHDAGYISYATRFRMVDLVGLKTPEVSALHSALTQPSAGRLRSQAIHQIAMHYRPQYLVVLAGWDRLFEIVPGLEAHGWHMERLRVSGGYSVLQMTPPPESQQAGRGRLGRAPAAFGP